MKFFKKLKVMIILFFCVFNGVFSLKSHERISNRFTSSLNQKSKIKVIEQLNTVQKYKFLFMLKWPSVRGDQKHPLNILSYKNVLLSTSQIVFFVSQSPLNSQVDETWDTSHYIFTMTYEYLDLPCLNRSYVCTHSQFVKEYRPIYPELNFNIPSEISERFVEPQKASNNCIIIFLNPPVAVEEAAWLCHDSLDQVYELQDKLSRIIREANSKSYDFLADYIIEKNQRMSGVVTLQNEELRFQDLSGRMSLKIPFQEINPYAISLYLKEDLQWTGGLTGKPESARCLKIQRKGESYSPIPDYFCIYYSRSDVKGREPLNIIQARYMAEMYTNKINNRLQSISLSAALNSMNQRSGSIEVDSNVLSPIKNQVRNDYFIVRHKMLNFLKMEKITRDQFEINIQKTKEKIINSVCSGIEVCKKAMHLSLNRGLLPLKGYRERFAMDIQNPFNSLVPKTNIKISLPNGGSVGRKLLEQVNDLISAKERNFMTDPIPDSAPGEIPNVVTLKKAFNTFVALRDRTKFYGRVEELGQNCRANVRINSNNLKRKVAILSYVGTHDTFFEYLGHIRNEMISKPLF